MNIEQIQNYDLHINGQQAGLIFKTIKQLDIKEEIGNVIFGDIKAQEIAKKYQIASMKYQDLFNIEVQKHMTMIEFKTLKKAEREELWTDKLMHNEELYNSLLIRETLKMDYDNIVQTNQWGLMEKILLDKYYSNQEAIYELLANLYKTTQEEVANSSITVIMAMFKKITESKDIEGMKNLFK